MESIHLHGDEKRPTVELNKQGGVFKIEGRSVPEDAQKFYAPFLTWLEEYKKTPNRITCFEINLDYMNTASSMMVLALLLQLKSIHQEGKTVLIKWHFSEEDMQDAGVNFEDATNLPFEHIGEIDDEF